MSTNSVDEVRKAIAACIEAGEVLRVDEISEEIARVTGEKREWAAKALLEAGTMASVDIELGPDLSGNGRTTK